MKTKQRICVGTRWLASNSAIIATTLLFFGCDSAVEYFTYVPSGQSTRTPDAQWNDRSFHEIVKSSVSTEEKIQRVKQLIEKGGNLNELDHGTTPVMKAVGWGGQYRLAVFLLENGADHRIYMKDSNQRLIHFVSRENTRAARGSSVDKFYYASLVKWLEAHGESMAEAEKDRERWRSWVGSPAHIGRLRRAEIAAREKRQQKEALPEQQPARLEGNAQDE